MSEIPLFIATALIIIVIFVTITSYLFIFSEESKISEAKAEFEKIIEILKRVKNSEAKNFYVCIDIRKSDISIIGNKIEFKRGGNVFVKYLDFKLPEKELKNVNKICVSKTNEKIEIKSSLEGICNYNGICEPSECLTACSDCFNAEICKGDGVCNRDIGESCVNSVDCQCKDDEICCPSSIDANEFGCSKIKDLKKGEECWCDEQCENGLKCNPTSQDFTQYEKACCEPGKVWNGKECVEEKVYVVVLVPAFYSQDQLKNFWPKRARNIKNFIEKTLPFRENPSILKVLIGNENCEMRHERDVKALLKCGNEIARKAGFSNADMVGGILGICVGGDGCGNILGYTVPGEGWFIHGYDICVITKCPSVYDAVVAPHEIGHNFRLCEGYCYDGRGTTMCYKEEKISFGGYCGTSRIEQKFPHRRSATPNYPCGNCYGLCCLGRKLDGDPINDLSGGRDIMGPGDAGPIRAFACDSYLAFKDVAINIYGFNLPKVTDKDIDKCYKHIKGDTYP